MKTANVKLAPVSAVLLSQFVKSEAGAVDAQYDMRLCAVYTAYLSALKDGNKTQLMMVEASAKTYNTPKACRELTATPDRTTPAATRASKVYQAYGFALAECGIPGLLKIDGKRAPVETAQLEAEKLAVMFVDVVTAALTPAPKVEKTEAEKEIAKKAKEDKDAAAKLALEQEIDEAATKKAATMAAAPAAPEQTITDMAKSVEMAVLLGTLEKDVMESLYAAIQGRMTAEMLARTEQARAEGLIAEDEYVA